MKKIIYSTLITFVINLILQVSVNYFTAEKNGEIIVSNPLRIDSVNYSQTIIISNYEGKTIENLEFSISNGKISSLLCNNPISYKLINNNNFQIEKIYPKTNNTIQINFVSTNVDPNEKAEVKALNYSDYNLTSIKSSDFSLKQTFDWRTIILNCVLVSLIYGIFFYFFLESTEKSIKRIEDKNKDLEVRVTQTRKSLDEVTNDSKIQKNRLAKVKLLLLKKSTDLKIENQYYKSLIKSIIENSKATIDKEKLENLIRTHLKTYTTKSGIDIEIDSIDIIASIVKDKES